MVPHLLGAVLPFLIQDCGMLGSLHSDAYGTPDKLGVMTVLQDPVFDIFWGCMAYCSSQEGDWLQCTSSGFPYNFNMDVQFVCLWHETNFVLWCELLCQAGRECGMLAALYIQHITHTYQCFLANLWT